MGNIFNKLEEFIFIYWIAKSTRTIFKPFTLLPLASIFCVQYFKIGYVTIDFLKSQKIISHIV